MKHRLRELRQNKGLTQQEVATILGIPFKTYSALERGYRGKLLDRGLSLALKCSELYGKSVEYIFVKEERICLTDNGSSSTAE